MALYHTHRPQRFDAVIGQDHVITTITNQIMQGTIAHAYLFAGPRGVGKTTTARLIAKAVNVPCDPKTGEPDNSHPDAQDITKGKSIDVIEIDAASHTGVDHVREHIIDNAQFRPTKLKYKVFIIDEVHMLSTSAFNALLKTLEEPPSYTIFILATTELHKLPATIISRCQRYTFRHVPQDILIRYLEQLAQEEKRTIDTAVLERIAYKSEGCVRDAVSLLDQVLSISQKHIQLADVNYLLPAMLDDEAYLFIEQLIAKDSSAALRQVNDLYEQGTNIKTFFDQVIEMSRALMITSITKKAFLQESRLNKKIQALAESISVTESLRCLEVFLRYRAMIAQSPIAQLPLEMAIVELVNQPSQVHATPTMSVPVIPSAPTIAPPITTPTAPVAIQQEKKPMPSAVVPEPTTVIPKEETATTPIIEPATVSKSEVEQHWPGVLKQMEQQAPSLLFLLKTATITGVEGNRLLLSVEHTFHRDKLLDVVNAKKITAALQQLMGKALVLDVRLVERSTNTPEVNALAASFGADIIPAV